jgi:hypothetical protein
MYPASSPARSAEYPRGPLSWFRRAETWLDERGRPAWIVATVAGFVVFWPVGLGLLGYMIWSKRMFNRSSSCAHRRAHRHADWQHQGRAWSSSGNSAFDAYKADTLRRLEEEQEAFETFLQRLRDAKDKSEFDTFMEERARANRAADPLPGAPEAGRGGEY